MGLRITVPWNIHLRGSAHSTERSWWKRRKFHDDPGAHPTLMKEQDLDHLGELHDKVVHSGKH